MLPSARDTTSAPRCGLSRLITTACTLAVYASWLENSLAPRKTRFRWVASPCRVGFGPTGSTSKGFRIHLLHPSPLSRLSLARVTSPKGHRPVRTGRVLRGHVEAVFLLSVLEGNLGAPRRGL